MHLCIFGWWSDAHWHVCSVKPSDWFFYRFTWDVDIHYEPCLARMFINLARISEDNSQRCYIPSASLCFSYFQVWWPRTVHTYDSIFHHFFVIRTTPCSRVLEAAHGMANCDTLWGAQEGRAEWICHPRGVGRWTCDDRMPPVDHRIMQVGWSKSIPAEAV